MKRTINLRYLLGALLMIFIIQASYPTKSTDNKQQLLLAKANIFNLKYPQEKIYLHLDRPSYWANEDIWFKAYLMDSPIPDCN